MSVKAVVDNKPFVFSDMEYEAAMELVEHELSMGLYVVESDVKKRKIALDRIIGVQDTLKKRALENKLFQAVMTNMNVGHNS